MVEHVYRLRSEGDNVLGQHALSRLNPLTYDLDIRYVG